MSDGILLDVDLTEIKKITKKNGFPLRFVISVLVPAYVLTNLNGALPHAAMLKRKIMLILNIPLHKDNDFLFEGRNLRDRLISVGFHCCINCT